MKTDKQINKEIEEKDNQEAKIEEQIGALEDELSDKRDVLEEQIEKLEEPYHAKIQALKKKRDKLRDEAERLGQILETRAEKQVLEEAKEKGTLDANSFCALISLKTKGKITPPLPTIKKILKNGVIVLRFRRWDSLSFVFIQGLKVVGLWNRRDSEHRGDVQQSIAWVGVRKIYSFNQIEHKLSEKTGYKDEKHPFYRKTDGWYSTRSDPTIYQFMDYVEGLSQKQLVAIDLDNDENLNMLRQYGWER